MTETGHRSAFGFYAAQLIAIRRDQGRLDELVTLVAGQVQRRGAASPPAPINNAFDSSSHF